MVQIITFVAALSAFSAAGGVPLPSTKGKLVGSAPMMNDTKQLYTEPWLLA